MNEEIKSQVKDEARKIVRQSLDATETGLQRQLEQTVRRRQHNEGASTIDVQNAANALQEFRDSRARRELELIRKIDSGGADSNE